MQYNSKVCKKGLEIYGIHVLKYMKLGRESDFFQLKPDRLPGIARNHNGYVSGHRPAM